jgi:hypothetical protein
MYRPYLKKVEGSLSSGFVLIFAWVCLYPHLLWITKDNFAGTMWKGLDLGWNHYMLPILPGGNMGHNFHETTSHAFITIQIADQFSDTTAADSKYKLPITVDANPDYKISPLAWVWPARGAYHTRPMKPNLQHHITHGHAWSNPAESFSQDLANYTDEYHFPKSRYISQCNPNFDLEQLFAGGMSLAPNHDDIYNVFNKRPDLVYRYRSGQIYQKAQDEAWPDYNTRHVSDLIYPFTWPMVFSNHIRTPKEMEGRRMHMLYTPSYEPLYVKSNRKGLGRTIFTQFNNLNKHYELQNQSVYWGETTSMQDARYGGGRTEFVLYRDYLVYGMDMNNVINKRIEMASLSRTPYSTLLRCLFGTDENYYWNTETNVKEVAPGDNVIDLKAKVKKKLNTLGWVDKWSQVTRWYTTMLLVMVTGKIFFSSQRDPANLEWLLGANSLQLQSTCLVFWILLRYLIVRRAFGDVCFDDGYLVGSSAPIGDLIRTKLPGFSCTWYLSGRRQSHEVCALLTCLATWMINFKGKKVPWHKRTAHIGYGGYKFGCYFFLVFTMYFNSVVAAQVAIMAFNGVKDQSTFGMKTGFPMIDWFLTAGNVAIEWGEYFDFAIYMLIIYHTVDITAGYVTNKHNDILKFRSEDKLDCIRPFFIMLIVFGVGQHRLYFIEGAPYDFWGYTLNQPWNSAWYFNTILFKMRCWKIFVLVKFLQQCENFMERNNRIIYKLMRFFITFIFITFYLGNAYFWTSCTQSVARQPWVDTHFYIGLPVFDVYSQDMKLMYTEWWDTWKNNIQAMYCCDNQIDRDEFGEPNGTTYHGDMVCRLGDPSMSLPYGDGNHVREFNREWQAKYLEIGGSYMFMDLMTEGTYWDQNPDLSGNDGPEFGMSSELVRKKYCPAYNKITWDVFWWNRFIKDCPHGLCKADRMLWNRAIPWGHQGHHEVMTFAVPNGDMVLAHYQTFLLHNYIFPTLSCQGWPSRQCDASNFVMGWTRQKGGQRYGQGWGSKIPGDSITLLQELYGENGSRMQHDHRTLISKIGSQLQMADWSNQVMLDEVEFEHNQWAFNRTLEDGSDNPNAKHWPSLYFEHVPVTIWYSMMQIISTAGLGDMAPTTALEKCIYIATMILTVGVVEIGLFNTIDGFIKSEVNEKTSYVRSAVAGFFAYCGAENTHHIDRSQSSLWLHWHLWHGLMPLAPENADLNILPAPILQEIYYSVFMSILKQNKSKVFSKMNNNQLKYMARGMYYGITHKGDAIINSVETQSFVLIIFNGRFKVMDHQDNELQMLMGGEVYYETECFLGLAPPGRIIAASTHVEYFRIDKKWYNSVIHSYPLLYEKLVNALVEGGVRQLERDTESTYISLEPKVEALEGLESPVCAQNVIYLPKVSDILTYKAHSVKAKLHRDTKFNLKDIDGATKTLVNMANVMMARQNLATAHAYQRTEKRNVLRTVEEEENRELQIAGMRDVHLGILNDWMATGVAQKDRAMRKTITRQSMQIDAGGSELGDMRMALQQQVLTQGTSQTSVQSLESFPELPEKIFSQEDTTLDAMRAEQREAGERGRSIFVLFYGVFTTFAFFLILVECGFYNKTKGTRPFMFFFIRYLVDIVIWANWFYIEVPNLKENRRVSGFSDESDNWINVAFHTFEIHTSILIAMVPWEFLYFFSGGYGNFATWFFYCRLLGKFHHLQNCARAHFEKKAHKLYASPWVYLIQWIITLVGCIQFTACLSYWWPCGSAPVHEDFDATCMPGSWPWMLFEEGDSVLAVPDT